MKCEVLLSTYNGEKYIADQLDSIITQTIETHITARDDGSEDSTVGILQSYKDVDVIQGKNVGATESFLNLIEKAPESDYYAFCDQDDVWDRNKLECAISMLKRYESIPAIYSSNTRLVDSELRFIKSEKKKPVTVLGSAIVKNYATGCTVVFNNKLMIELRKCHPAYFPYHDWWVNLVCLSIGGVSIFDKNTQISYRQHGNNLVSGNESFLKQWKYRLSKFNKPYGRDKMAKELLDCYDCYIVEDNRTLLRQLSEYKKNKLNVVMNRSFRTGSISTDLLFRLCVLTNRI